MRSVRILIVTFMVLLILSGLSAFPVRTEVDFLIKHLDSFSPAMQAWIQKLKSVVDVTPDIIMYGTDWLAFAHIIISLFFIPVIINPVKYQVNLRIGMIACLAVFPLAFICGPFRGIPFFHQLIDCAFGVGGILFLLTAYKKIKQLEKTTAYEISK